VIGFGVQAFALELFKRVYQTLGTDDLKQIHDADVHVSWGDRHV
jgi:multisubunit Na+/H+ antiporter MnhC subunit